MRVLFEICYSTGRAWVVCYWRFPDVS